MPYETLPIVVQAYAPSDTKLDFKLCKRRTTKATDRLCNNCEFTQPEGFASNGYSLKVLNGRTLYIRMDRNAWIIGAGG